MTVVVNKAVGVGVGINNTVFNVKNQRYGQDALGQVDVYNYILMSEDRLYKRMDSPLFDHIFEGGKYPNIQRDKIYISRDGKVMDLQDEDGNGVWEYYASTSYKQGGSPNVVSAGGRQPERERIYISGHNLMLAPLIEAGFGTNKILRPQDYHGQKGHVHHLDNDHTNNDPSNLIWLPMDVHYFFHKSKLDLYWYELARIVRKLRVVNKTDINDTLMSSSNLTKWLEDNGETDVTKRSNLTYLRNKLKIIFDDSSHGTPFDNKYNPVEAIKITQYQTYTYKKANNLSKKDK